MKPSLVHLGNGPAALEAHGVTSGICMKPACALGVLCLHQLWKERFLLIADLDDLSFETQQMALGHSVDSVRRMGFRWTSACGGCSPMDKTIS